MKTPEFLVFSDFHLHEWKKHNKEEKSRLDHQLDFLVNLCQQSSMFEIPILFCGDWFHIDKTITNSLINKTFEVLSKTFHYNPNAHIYGISGNHDQFEQNDIHGTPMSWMSMLSMAFHNNIHCIDKMTIRLGKFTVTGIPYITGNVGLVEYLEELPNSDILLIHTDLPGAKDTNLRVIDEAKNFPTKWERSFSKFGLVLAGHIHLPQKLGNNIYMVGAPMHQRLTDIGSSLGYWVIDSHLKMAHHDSGLPEFKFIEDLVKVDEYHMWIPKPKQVESIKASRKEFNTNLTKKALVKKYFEVTNTKNLLVKKKTLDIIQKVDGYNI